METFHPYIEELKKRKDVDGLIQALSSGDWGTRSSAARALGYVGEKRAVAPLVESLRYSNSLVRAEKPIPDFAMFGFRENALMALAKIEDRHVQELFATMLNDPNNAVRWCAAYGLSKCGDPRAIEYFERVLKKEENLEDTFESAKDTADDMIAPDALRFFIAWRNPPQYVCAAYILAEISNARGIEYLFRTMDNPESKERHVAAYLLTELGDPRAVNYYLQSKPSSDDLTREMWEYAFRVGANAQLVEGLKNSKGHSLLVVIALGATCHPSAIEPLIDILLHDSTAWNRNAAANFLGEIGQPDALSALFKSKFQVRNWVRLPPDGLDIIGNVRWSQETIRWRKRPFSQLISELQNPDTRMRAVRALGQIADPRATEFLIPLLDIDAETCQYVAKALGRIGDPHALPELKRLAINCDRKWQSHPPEGMEIYRAESEARAALRKIRRCAIESLAKTI